MRLQYLLIAMLMLSPYILQAQRIRQSTMEGFEFTDVEFDDLQPPYYQPQEALPARRDQRWLRIMVEYDVSGNRDEWVDELVLDWSVAITPGNDRPLLMRTRVEYTDIRAGEDHWAAVYVRPAILLRYYGDDTVTDNDILVYIQVSINGRPAGTLRYNDADAPDNWWQAREPQVTLRPDELLPRSKTPYAVLNADFFEYIKSTE